MNFKIKRTRLLKALENVNRAVSSKNPLPVLTGIKFETRKDGLVLTGSNSDITIQTKITEDLDIIETGGIVLSARYILEIIKKIESDYIHVFILDGNLTRIEGADSKFDLNGTDVADYPNIELRKQGQLLSINSIILKNSIEQTLFATSDKETRPVLTGVNIEANGNVLKFIATNSFRLARKVIEIDNDLSFNIIVPKKSLLEVERIIDKDEMIEIYISDRRLLIIIDDIYIQTRLIDGRFPDTNRIIPTEFNSTLTSKSSYLLNAIDRASLITSEQKTIINLKMSSDQVILTSYSKEIGSLKENLNDCFYEGKPLNLSFNARYMAEAIRYINSEKIIIEFTSELKPMIVKAMDQNDVIQLILPVRTQSNM